MMELDIIQERYELAANRIKEIAQELSVAEEEYLGAGLADYFAGMAEYLCALLTQRGASEHGFGESGCFVNGMTMPVSQKEHGRILFALSHELRSMEAFVKVWCIPDIVIRLELFLEVYAAYACEWQENRCLPECDAISSILYWFAFDYADVAAEQYADDLISGGKDGIYLNSDSILYGFLPGQAEESRESCRTHRREEVLPFAADKAYLSRRLEAFRTALKKCGVQEEICEEYCGQAKKYVAHLA